MAFEYKGTRNGAQRNLMMVKLYNSITVAVGDVVQVYTNGSATNGAAALPLKGIVHAIVEAENQVKPSLPSVIGSSTAGSANASNVQSVTTAVDNTTTGKYWVMVDTSVDSLYSAEVSGTIDTTTNSGDPGGRIDVDSATTDYGRVLETTHTRTIGTPTNFYNHGVDPEDSERLVVSLAMSEETSVGE